MSTRRKKYSPKELMKAMGSKDGRFDPEPPEQYLWELEHGGPTDKFVALTKALTVGMNHNSPYAVDERGKSVYLDYYRTVFDWAQQTIENVAWKTHQEGRVRLDPKAKRVYLTAQVAPQQAENDGEDGRTEGEGLYFAQSMFPSYVIAFIKSLPAEKQAPAIARYRVGWKYQEELRAECDRAWRATWIPIEDSILQELGYDKKRLPARHPESQVVKKLEVTPFHEWQQFAQSMESECANSSNGSRKAKNGSARSAASLLTTATATDTATNSRSAPLRSSDSVEKEAAGRQANACVPALSELRKHFTEPITDQSLIQLDADLTERYPALYFAAEFVKAVGDRQKRKPAIRYGLLLKQDPGLFVDEYFQDEKRKLEARIAAVTMKQKNQQEDDQRLDAQVAYTEFAESQIEQAIASASEEERAAARKQAAAADPDWKRLTPELKEDRVIAYLRRRIREGLISFEQFCNGGRLASASGSA